MTGRVHVERRGAAAMVLLDNTTQRNALSRQMILDLLALLRELDDDPEVACIVVRGAGGTFCSGLDLTSLGRSDAGGVPDEHSMIDLAERLEEAFARLRTMSVAVVERFAIGAGCQIALGCTIRLAAPDACFAVPVGRLGLVYPPTSVERLVELVGPSRAMLMLSTGRRVDAHTAWAWGLATDLVGSPTDADVEGVHRVDADLDAFLAEVAAGSRLSLAGSLEMVQAVRADARAASPGGPGASGSLGRAAAVYERWSALSESSGEHAEALAARAEKRPPAFPWRPSH